ncbi:MAG: dipeptidase [Pseudomonadota bacterium]
MTWQSYLNDHSAQYVDELLEFVAIPSVSAKDDHADEVRRAGQWVVNRLEKAGLEHIQMLETGGHPVVYADWLHAGADKPTVMIYGHFDVQPGEPFDLWESPAFEPEVRHGCLFGRGASDDKGGMLIPILSAEAMLQTDGRLPVNVKFFFEGQEEIGSPQLPEFVAKYRDLLTCDMIFSADGGQWSPEEPQMVTALRGIVALEITVTGAKGDLHSGMHGGGVANPLLALGQMLAGMKGPDGRIAVDGFYDAVVDLSDEDREAIARVPFDEEAYKADLDIPETLGEPGYSTRESLWARPTFEVNGMWGGYQGVGTKTVLPCEAHAKVTCRLVANQTPEEVFAKIAEHVDAHTPPGVRAEVRRLGASGDPFLVPTGHNASQAAREVLAEVYGKEPYVTRVGGSIPVMSIFLKELGVHGVMFGFGCPDENIHAPNEFYRLASFERGRVAYCKLLERLGA